MAQAIKDLIELISHKPWVIFIVLVFAFGYGLYAQDQELTSQNAAIISLTGEVSGLRSEVTHMDEIIKLNVDLAVEKAKAAAKAEAALMECAIE